MNSKVITETFKGQVESLVTLDHNERNVASIQTLRMSLVMFKYYLDKEEFSELFSLYDKELRYLLTGEEDVGEYTQDCHEAEGDCCVKKEDFSEDEKEDSEWASRLSEVHETRREIIKISKGKDIAPIVDNTMCLIDITTAPVALEMTESDPVTAKQRELLEDLYNHGFYVPNYRKLLDVLEMYRGEDDEIVRSTNVFKLVFDKGCGNILLSYLKK